MDTAMLKEGRGIVNVSVVSNFPDIDEFTAIEIEKLEGKGSGSSSIASSLRLKNKLNTNLFSFQLEPGEYKIRQIRTNPNPNGYVYCQASDKADFSFTVGTGKVTDLGAIVLVRTDRSACQILRDPRKKPISNDIARAWPDYSIKIKIEPTEAPLSWKNNLPPYESLAMYIATHVTPTIHNPVVLDDGVMLAGSELGQVLIRLRNGAWKNVSTDTYNTILFVTSLDGTGFVISGELNTFILVDEGKHTEISTDGLPKLPIVYVDHHPGVGLLVFFQDERQIHVYVTADPRAPKWERYSSLQAGSTFWGYKNTVFKTVEDRIYIASTPDNLQIFNVGDRQWQNRKLPGKPLDMSVSKDHQIIVLANDGWHTYNHLSQNEGVNWEPLNKESVTNLAHVSNRNSIIMLSEDTNPKILETKNKGDTWNIQREGKQGNLFVSGNVELIFGNYDWNRIGSSVYSYIESDSKWYWERATDYHYNRKKLLEELEKRFSKK